MHIAGTKIGQGQQAQREEEGSSEFDFTRARRRKKNLKRVARLLLVALLGFFGWQYWSQRPQMIWSKSWPTTNNYRYQDSMSLQLSGGFLYGLAADNTVHVLSAGTGREVWSYRPERGFYAAGLGVRDRLAIVLVEPQRRADRGAGTQLIGFDAFSGHERWRRNVGMNVRDRAVTVTAGSIYFTGGEGPDAAPGEESGPTAPNERLVATNLDGATRWEALLSGRARIKTVGNTVVAVQESKVDAFAAPDGRPLWSQPIRRVEGYGFIEGIPRAIEILPWRDRVVVWQAPDRITVRDGTSGAVLDDYRPRDLLSRGFGREALVVGDTLYVYSQFIGGGRDDVRAIDLTRKEVKWVSNIRAFYSGWPFGTSSYDSRPLAYSRGKIYLAARDGFVHGIDVRNGRSEFKKRIYKEGGGFDWNTPPIVSKGVLYMTEPHYREDSQTPIDIAAYKAA